MDSDDQKSIEAVAAVSQVANGSVGVERLHADLHRIARRELKRMARSGTIDTIALVSEAYLRVEGADRQWESRAHFFASMTTVMRHVQEMPSPRSSWA